MNDHRHLLVRASAGTGKTHELSSRYLALLLGGVDPDRVLATTFTRKAAHEILDRVLKRLADAARDGEKLRQLSKSIEREVSAEDCLASLERLLRGMDRIRIGTIDSFFAQLARLFALDLGLPPGWRIADEAESELLRSEAVADAVAGAGKLELLDLLRDFQKQAVGQGAHHVLLEFVGKGREILLESTPGAWTRVRSLEDVEPGAFEAAVGAVAGLPVPQTKDRKENKAWKKALQGIGELAATHEWIALLENGLIKKIRSGESSYSSVSIQSSHVEALLPIARHALHVLTSRLVVQNQASRTLLERYEASYQALSRARGLLRFEDLPNALAPVSGVDPLVARGIDLTHRIDGKIDHLLLDEFQDTAPVQWRVLRPLADGILADASGERSFFCVGDEKQSIYGWRAAEPRLLRDLGALRPMLTEKTLKESYRSSRAVLGAVNLVFATIAQSPAFEKEDPEVIAAAEEFQRAFVAHEPARERPGSVFLVRTPTRKEGEAEHVPVVVATVQRVRAILEDAPRATVGVLLRTRKRIPELIRRLRDVGIAASDEGGNPLTDSVAVLHALSLLHLADHPGDTAAAFHVASSPLGGRVGLEPQTLFAGRDREKFRRGSKLSDPVVVRAAAVAREVRAKLAELGFGGYLASIRTSEGYDAWDLERYGQLVDLALAWEGRAGSRPRAFVEHVRKTKVEDPSAARVRVMTVHGAKGLEFDAVVLPELDRSMKPRGETLLTMRPKPEGAIEVVSHGLPKDISPAHADLDEVRRDVVRRRMVEELCVLYVAMTRAVHRLDLIVQGREKEGGGLTNAAILRQAFDVDAAGDEGVAWKHPEGTEPWFDAKIGPETGEVGSGVTEVASKPRPSMSEKGEIGPQAKAVDSKPRESGREKKRIGPGNVEGERGAARDHAAPADSKMHAAASTDEPTITPTKEPPPLRLAPTRRPRSLASRSPSQAKDLGPVAASRLLLPRDAITARGRLVHRLLEEVEWIEGFDRSDEELLEIARRIESDGKLVASALAEFREALERPRTRRVLSRSGEDAEVWRERPFSLLSPDSEGNEVLWTGAFDRVVLRRNGGKAISAEIIDFKTDRVDPAALEARAESYRPQMSSYRRALARITGLPESAIEARLLFLFQDSVVTV